MLLLLKLVIFILTFASTGLLCNLLIPIFLERYHRIQAKKVTKAEKQLEEMFVLVSTKKLFLFYTITPLITGVISVLLFKSTIAVVIGAGFGFVLPAFIIKNMERMRKNKFQGQLVDALMSLSSSLKGGLSLLQAFEVLVEEMPLPINQEFSLMLRENKMGISLEESLSRLNKRMGSEELELVTNSILVARETGGDLTRVFSRLITTIRDKRKLQEHIETLTLQGRIQGVIMAILPFVFVTWVFSFNRHHFDIMLSSELGRMLLIIAGFLMMIGLVLTYRFSKMRF